MRKFKKVIFVIIICIVFSVLFLSFYIQFSRPQKNLSSLILACFSSDIAQNESSLREKLSSFCSEQSIESILYTIQIKGGLNARELSLNHGIHYCPKEIKILSQHQDILEFSFLLKIDGTRALVSSIQVEGRAQYDLKGKICYWNFSKMQTEEGEKCDFRSILNGYPN